MAKERLSNQQKWILQYLYKAHSDPSSEYNQDYFGGMVRGYHAKEILDVWCGDSYGPEQVSFSRSIINMEEKGLIDVERPRYTRSLTATRPHRGFARRVVLTDKGVETAKTLAASEAQI